MEIIVYNQIGGILFHTDYANNHLISVGSKMNGWDVVDVKIQYNQIIVHVIDPQIKVKWTS